MKSKLLTLWMVMLVLSSASVFGQNMHKSDDAREERKGNRMSELPNLNDKQKADMKSIRLSTMKVIQPLEDQLGEKEAKLNTLKNAFPSNLESINASLDEISAIKLQIAKKRAASEQEVRKILTEEQRLVFDKKAQHGERRHQRAPQNGMHH